MAPVFNLRGESGVHVDEFLEPSYLAGQQLQQTLGDHEHVAFVLLSKRGEVTVEREAETESYKAGLRKRVVTVVTDHRILVAVGGADGGDDMLLTIPLETIQSVDTESGFLGGKLRVETTANEQWDLPCKADLDEVVAYLDGARRAWSLADRLLAEIDERIEMAASALEEGTPAEARDGADAAESVIAHTRTRLATFEIGDAIEQNAGLDYREANIRAIRRQSYYREGKRAHETGQSHWRDGQFADAAESYQRAHEAYEQAAAFDAPRPPPEDVQAQMAALENEKRNLRRVPLLQARRAYEAVYDRLEPVERAQQLETALERYRTVLELSWGPDAAFDGDSETIRERIVRIVEDIVDARIDAARAALDAAATFEERDQIDPARSACETAREHIEAARPVASELAPETLDTIDACLAGIDQHCSELTATRTGGVTIAAEADEATTETAGDQSQSKKAAEWQSLTQTPTRESSDEQSNEAGVAMVSSDETGNPAPLTATDKTEQRLEELDRDGLSAVVETVWEALGWDTSAAIGEDSQCDIVATQDRPVALRILVWCRTTDLDEEMVTRCLGDRQEDDAADAATIVTTGEIPESVRERAARHNVKLVDRTDLLTTIEQENLHGQLPTEGAAND